MIANRADFEQIILIPPQNDGFDGVRVEYIKMALDQLSKLTWPSVIFPSAAAKWWSAGTTSTIRSFMIIAALWPFDLKRLGRQHDGQKGPPWAGGRFDLLGMICLPNNAFLSNAGTDITTDFIILQKLDVPRTLRLEPSEWVLTYTILSQSVPQRHAFAG